MTYNWLSLWDSQVFLESWMCGFMVAIQNGDYLSDSINGMWMVTITTIYYKNVLTNIVP